MRPSRLFIAAGKVLAPLFVLSPILSACAPLLGPIGQADHRRVLSATVLTPSPIYRDGKDLIRIIEIDGSAPRFQENRNLVTPGIHSFRVQLELRKPDSDNTEVTKADRIMSFETEADKEYLINAKQDEQGQVWLWAEETQGGIIVSGKKVPSKSSR